MKLIAYYLPQFHEIEENNQMWGKGFTEWTNVKRAVPLFEGHEQPIEPLNDNYYNLLDADVIKWQSKLAKQYGISAFCFYHYWYNGHKLLEKPIELFLKRTDINMPFCICWANHDWTSSWAGKEFKVIYRQDYSNKIDWKNHFDYLLPYLKDERYIKNDGKPLLVIYEAARIPQMNKMLDYWQILAKENGFSGIEFAYQCVTGDTIVGFNNSRFTYDIEYQPQYVRELVYKRNTVFNNTKSYYLRKWFGRFIKRNENKPQKNVQQKVKVVDYDDVWSKVLKMGPVNRKSIPGAFVRMDTTPRMQNRGFVTQGMTPDKFKKYLSLQIKKCKHEYKKNMIFLFAWNEWAEGGYLEPDKKWGYKVLEAIKAALEENGEFPEC